MSRLFLILGLALCALGVKAYVDSQTFKTSPLRARAVVEERLPGTLWNRTPMAPRVALRYESGGRSLRVTTRAVSPALAELKKGDTIELVLSTKDPARFIPSAALPTAGSFGTFLFIVGAGLLLFVFLQNRS